MQKLGEALALIHVRCVLGQYTRALYVVAVINMGDVGRQRGQRKTYQVSLYMGLMPLSVRQR